MKVGGFLWILLLFLEAKAFTISSVNRWISYTTTVPPHRLFYQNKGEDEPYLSSASFESEHVSKIRTCKSMDMVVDTLQQATSELGVDSVSTPSKSSILTQILPPNLAAAALLRSTQLCSRLSVPEQDGTLMWSLIKRLEDCLFLSGDESIALNVYALVDALSALAIVNKKLRFGQFPDVVTGQEADQRIRQFAIQLVERIDQQREEVLRVLRPFRMVNVYHALHALELDRSITEDIGSHNPAASTLKLDLCRKLVGGHALSVLSAGDMSIALTTLASIGKQLQPEECKLAVALMRRFRKQGVRQSATCKQLRQAQRAATEIGIAANSSTHADGDAAAIKLFPEAQTMVFTVFKENLRRHSEEQDDNQQAKHRGKESLLKLAQLTEMLHCLSTMQVLERQSGPSETTLNSLWESVLNNTSHNAFDGASVEEMARFVKAVEAIKSEELALGPDVVRHLGEHFRDELLVVLEETTDTVHPQSVNIILRFAALRWRHDAAVLDPFWGCAQKLFTNELFLAGCSAAELTNFLIFLAKIKHHVASIGHSKGATDSKADPLLAIVTRILDPDIVDAISPAQASRILSSFTAVVSERSRHDMIEPSEASVNATRNLFHAVGGHLLTDSAEEMSPRDISDALCAYAKANYVQDLGIFDHLASLLADRAEDCSIRQISQSLWACGRISIWEARDKTAGQEASFLPPPYLASANCFAYFLSERKDEMTTKDLAQAVWALARLQPVQRPEDDEPAECLDDFVWRASTLAPQLTSQEVANILWGMSRIGYRDCDLVVKAFTDRILRLHALPGETTTPQEAANVMMALGRMNIQSEEVFQVLSNDMLDQIDIASAQAIALALSAHKSVKITPPRQLLDRWATERLGLVAVQPRRRV